MKLDLRPRLRFRILGLVICILAQASGLPAGVSRSIQEQYKRDYENKALFLKIPVYAEKQRVSIAGQSFRIERGSGSPRFKVGDQIRVLLVDFGGDEIRFRLSGIETAGLVELGFKFDAELQDGFPNKDVFDRALRAVFTEGLRYADIEDAKQAFVVEQFERSVGEIAGSASVSRETVLRNVAPHVPAYQEAQREIESLRGKLQDVSAQLAQSQAENRKRESELKTLQAEFARLKSAHAALQEKMENSALQVSKMGEELRDARGTAQGYQKELASLQRSLNLKVDPGRDLAAQIAELGLAMRKLQNENDSLKAQIGSLQNGFDAQRAAQERLVKDNEELKTANRQMQSTIQALTSKEDSLARQYLDLSKTKERLELFVQAARAVHTRVTEDTAGSGFRRGKAEVYLGNVLLGSLNWSLPAFVNHNATVGGEAAFSAESIDYVRVTPEERRILRSLGDRLKMRVELLSDTATVSANPLGKESVQEIGERDRRSWKWDIRNRGTQDARLVLAVRLINANSDEIPLLQQHHAVASSNIVRRAREHLRPIPLAVGVVIGFLLFGIAGIFRRARKDRAPGKQDEAGRGPDPREPIGRKQL